MQEEKIENNEEDEERDETLENTKKLLLGSDSIKLLPDDFIRKCQIGHDIRWLKIQLPKVLLPVLETFMQIEKALCRLYTKNSIMTLEAMVKDIHEVYGLAVPAHHVKFLLNLDKRLYKLTTGSEGLILFEPSFCYQDCNLKWFCTFRRIVGFGRLFILQKSKHAIPPPNLTIVTDYEWLKAYQPNLESTSFAKEIEIIFADMKFLVETNQKLAQETFREIEEFNSRTIDKLTPNNQFIHNYEMDIERPTHLSRNLTVEERLVERKIQKQKSSSNVKQRKKSELLREGLYKPPGRPRKNRSPK